MQCFGEPGEETNVVLQGLETVAGVTGMYGNGWAKPKVSNNIKIYWNMIDDIRGPICSIC